MAAGSHVPPSSASARKWRTFADVVALALGLNVWISMAVLPALFLGLWHGGSTALFLVAPVLLGVGLWRRSEVALLAGFPAAVLLPIAFHPAMASAAVYGPVRWAVVALGCVAYVFGVAFFMTFHEPPVARSVRSLASAAQGQPQRWRRRERIYWYLFALCLIVPTALFVWLLFDKTILHYLGEMYPGRVALMSTGIAVAILTFWLMLYQWIVLGMLRPHRTGDRDVLVALAELKQHAAKGKPRLPFYLAVVLALAAMVLLLVRP